LKNVGEKNQESPEEAENLANYSAKDEECTYIIFLHIFSLGIFKQKKINRKSTRSGKVWQIILQQVKIVLSCLKRISTSLYFPKTPSNGK